MIDSAEYGRRHARRAFHGQVRGCLHGATFYGTIRDVSLGGMCFEVDYLFKVGTVLELLVATLDQERRSATVNAEVVWVEPLHMLYTRVGVRFEELSPKARRVIAACLLDETTLSEPSPSGAAKYPLLFSPWQLSSLTLKNRLTMAPMFWGHANEDGTASQPLIARYREIASGGVAMIVVGSAIVHPSGIMASRALRIDDDRFMPGLMKLAAAIKTHGALCCLQINHAGRWAKVDKPLAPSAVAVDLSSEWESLDGMRKGLSGRQRVKLVNNFISAVMRCRQGMTFEEIDEIKNAFGQAALRAKRAGFDMVELHGATGYLLSQFLSPRSNKRCDDYGGDLEKRMRFPLEVVDAVRQSVGREFPVGYRLMAEEWLPDGFCVDEASVFASRLAQHDIDYLSVTAGTYESFFLPDVMNHCRKEGYIASLAARIRRGVSRTPVIAAGRIVRPALAEKMLKNGDADLIGLARPLFADPLWPTKALEGREKEIVVCTCCNTCLLSAIKDEPVTCARWDRFARLDVTVRLKQKTRKWERVLIALDGSDGSLAAAEYAGQMIGRGKKVTLFAVVSNDKSNGKSTRKMEKLLGQARERLSAVGLPGSDIRVKIAVKNKGVAEDILEEIKKGEYGSVILGRRGISRTRQLLFGSVSNHIVRYAKGCGVWVID